MQFPLRDLTNQYISLSYQSVVQTYTSNTSSYFLDGLGNVILYISTASLGSQIITSDQIIDYSISSSYSLVSEISISSSYSLESSYCDTSSLSIESIFSNTSSFTLSYPGSGSFVPYTNANQDVDLGNYGISGSNIIVVGPVEPPNPIDGKLWWDTDDTTPTTTIISSSHALISDRVNRRIETITTSSSIISGIDVVVLVNAISGSITITLPSAIGNANMKIDIKKIDNSSYPITISGSEDIDHDSNKIITQPYSNLTIISNNQQWYIL